MDTRAYGEEVLDGDSLWGRYGALHMRAVGIFAEEAISAALHKVSELV